VWTWLCDYMVEHLTAPHSVLHEERAQQYTSMNSCFIYSGHAPRRTAEWCIVGGLMDSIKWWARRSMLGFPRGDWMCEGIAVRLQVSSVV
jgi:hypothetical protein